MSTYGKQFQLDQSVAAVLHELTVSGYHIYAAFVNDEEVTEKYKDDKNRRWDHEQFKGYFPILRAIE